MRFTWDEVKRKRNLKDHGLDFVDAKRVFEGLLEGIPVSIVHTETKDRIHVIEMSSFQIELTPSLIDPYQLQQQTARLNPTARLTIGKRISDRVYLTFSRSLNTIVNDQIVLLEYDESDRVSWILSRNEDSQTYALEFRVRHIF